MSNVEHTRTATESHETAVGGLVTNLTTLDGFANLEPGGQEWCCWTPSPFFHCEELLPAGL
jgi:hypothetical protein